MTDAQWWFEYKSIKAKEDKQLETMGALYKNAMIASREMLIELLGLHIAADDEPQTVMFGDEEVEVSNHTPLVLLAGNPAMITGAFENKEDSDKIADALNDPEFEAFSAALEQDLDGDMDPMMLGPTDPDEIMKEKWFSPFMQDMVGSLGIKTSEDRTKFALEEITKDNQKQVDRQKKQKVRFRFGGDG
jgi:hypothetical protein